MPPVNQGSRAALVTWTVVTSILFVTSVILAIVFYLNADKSTQKYNELVSVYNDVLTRDMIREPQVEALRAARSSQDSGLNASMKLLDVAFAQRNQLSRLITGSEDNPAAAKIAQGLVEKVKAAGVNPANDNLYAAIDAALTALRAAQTEATNNKTAANEANTKRQQTMDAVSAQINQLKQALEAVQQERDKVMEDLAAQRKLQETTFNGTSDDFTKRLAEAQSQIDSVTLVNKKADAEITQLKAQIALLQVKLGGIRAVTSAAILQHADGKILSINERTNTCRINLGGSGDQVQVGLTFEVYDKFGGIPAPGDPNTDENLPIGKASIEVIKVDPASSECRIIHKTLGAGTLTVGDIIINLVYDKNIKYKFVVHGKFDLDQNGIATAKDTEVIKRLITQWGADVVNDINADTDFVVLGKEPVIPEKPADPEPVAQAEYDKAIAEYEAYGEVSAKAREYHIPILNQNRFLYFIGYYDQARR